MYPNSFRGAVLTFQNSDGELDEVVIYTNADVDLGEDVIYLSEEIALINDFLLAIEQFRAGSDDPELGDDEEDEGDEDSFDDFFGNEDTEEPLFILGDC